MPSRAAFVCLSRVQPRQRTAFARVDDPIRTPLITACSGDRVTHLTGCSSCETLHGVLRRDLKRLLPVNSGHLNTLACDVRFSKDNIQLHSRSSAGSPASERSFTNISIQRYSRVVGLSVVTRERHSGYVSAVLGG